MEKSDKSCPFLRQKCAKGACAIFNEKFRRCDIGLLAYNLYLFAGAVSELKLTLGAIDKRYCQDNNGSEGVTDKLFNL